MSWCPHCQGIRSQRQFDDLADFRRTRATIQASSELRPVPGASPEYAGIVEQRYRCAVCDRLWRLLEPDPPYRGGWEEITPANNNERTIGH